ESVAYPQPHSPRLRPGQPPRRGMMVLHCDCGAVRIDLSCAPEFLVDCDCSLCSAAQAYWGYFNPAEVHIEGETAGHTRDDKEQPSAEVHFCVKCDSTSHFRLTPDAQAKFGNSMMG